MSIFGKQLEAFLGFAMIVAAVSSFSVPGLLANYTLVEGDPGRRVFKLAALVDAEHFNLTATLLTADESYKDACEHFIGKTTENEVEILLLKKVNWTKLEFDKSIICFGNLSLHVSCQSVSRGSDDCEKTRQYEIRLCLTHV